MRTDPDSPTYSLPECLRVPTAATGPDAVATYVGKLVSTVTARNGRINALLVCPYAAGRPTQPEAPLWRRGDSSEIAERLFPAMQVWVHIDYRRYRPAYIRFGMPPIPQGYVLDHIQNREAIRLRLYSHPYVRLCSVSRKVNANGGHRTGTEGQEKTNIRLASESPSTSRNTTPHPSRPPRSPRRPASAICSTPT